MNNKTCGECKYYNDAMSHCEKFDCMSEDSWSCPDCEEKSRPKPTNGDVIRQMSNDELARKFGYPCPPIPNKHCKGISNEECTECWLNWLNAPADCVKQNGNHDTQADLCKADNTESEGKDE